MTLRNLQHGAVLVVSLIFLLLMSMIGISGMQGTTLEERMTGNMRDRSLAFQSAESALRDAESILSGAALPAFDGTVYGLYTATSSQPSFWDTIDWTDSSKVKAYGATLPHVATQPVYIIEELPSTTAASGGGSLEGGVPLTSSSTTSWYRITARGVGATNDAAVVLQSIFRI